MWRWAYWALLWLWLDRSHTHRCPLLTLSFPETPLRDMSPESDEDAGAKTAKKRTRHDVNPSDGSASGAKGAVKLPPRLYLNQFVSSRLVWREMGLAVTMEADGFAPGACVRMRARVPLCMRAWVQLCMDGCMGARASVLHWGPPARIHQNA